MLVKCPFMLHLLHATFLDLLHSKALYLFAPQHPQLLWFCGWWLWFIEFLWGLGTISTLMLMVFSCCRMAARKFFYFCWVMLLILSQLSVFPVHWDLLLSLINLVLYLVVSMVLPIPDTLLLCLVWGCALIVILLLVLMSKTVQLLDFWFGHWYYHHIHRLELIFIIGWWIGWCFLMLLV